MRGERERGLLLINISQAGQILKMKCLHIASPPPAPPNTQQVILIIAEKPLFLRRSLPHSHLHFSLSWLFSVSFNSSCHTCYSLAFFLPSCISPHCVFSPPLLSSVAQRSSSKCTASHELSTCCFGQFS